MSDTTPTNTSPASASSSQAPNAAAPAAAPKTFGQKAVQWFLSACLIIAGLGGILRGYTNIFTLPTCESNTSNETLRSIFKSKDVEVSNITDFKSVTDTSSEKTCQAHVETKDELADIGYRIYWEGWTTKVMITDVQAKPKQG
jgi:hypothetical protein